MGVGYRRRALLSPGARPDTGRETFRNADHMSHATTATLPNAELLDDLYQRWRKDHESVEPGLRNFFEGFEFGLGQTAASADASRQIGITRLIFAYRDLGHALAYLDPLEEAPRQQKFVRLLELHEFGLTPDDQTDRRVAAVRRRIRERTHDLVELRAQQGWVGAHHVGDPDRAPKGRQGTGVSPEETVTPHPPAASCGPVPRRRGWRRRAAGSFRHDRSATRSSATSKARSGRRCSRTRRRWSARRSHGAPWRRRGRT